MFKKIVCVGIERRIWKDQKTGVETVNWYVHGEVVDGVAHEGHLVFSAKLADPDLLDKLAIGGQYLLAYTSYNGYNKVVEVL